MPAACSLWYSGNVARLFNRLRRNTVAVEVVDIEAVYCGDEGNCGESTARHVPLHPVVSSLSMAMLLTIAGGVALLIFAVRFLRKGLDRLFGERLGLWLQRAGTGRGRAFGTGLGVSVLAPSSTTISLLAVQSVQSGHMTARQMLSVMLGANIGMTVMVQLVALELDVMSPVLILIGVILYQYTRQPRSRGIGQILLSLGLIFLAMALIKSAVPTTIEPESDLAQIIGIAENYPVMLMIIAAIVAMVTQSSTATIGLVIGLISAEAVGYPVAVPAVLGANVGLAITTLLIGWRRIESRRLAFGNLALKVIVALLGLAMLPLLLRVLDASPGPMTTQIAMLHTAFNVVLALIGLPLVGLLTAMLERIVPAPEPGSTFGPKYINVAPAEGTKLAMGQSLREIMHVAEIVRSMFDDIWRALKKNDEALARQVARRDDEIDLLDGEIKRFLTRLAPDDNEPGDSHERMRQLRYLSELETIGDIIDKNISELVIKKIKKGVSFSAEGAKELDEFHKRIAENLLIADTAFTTRDRDLAQQLLRHKEQINRHEQELRDRHFSRLTSGLRPSHETSSVHLDLLTHLKRVNSAVTHVAYAVLEDTKHDDDDLSVRSDTAE